jgi:hypothetical protein
VIVTATYIALIGPLALAAALAFGLGGRDAAAELIASGYRKARENADTMREDLRVGTDRARREAERLAERTRVREERESMVAARPVNFDGTDPTDRMPVTDEVRRG